MSHSTHVGFSAPPAADGSVGEPLPYFPPCFHCDFVGVGHEACRAMCERVGRTAAPGDGERFVPPSFAQGVGNNRM